MAFIKKNWQKDAANNGINAALRAAGAMGSAFAINKWFNDEQKKTLRNLAGPGMVVLGVLGDMVLEDQKLKALCQGITTYSLMHSVAVISPDAVAPAIGINGLAGTDDEDAAALMSGIGALGETSANEDEAEIRALAAGEQEYKDTDGKTYNNDWAYLAENIDNADKITKTVNGVDDESAAALMGVETDEEAALLMGMF